MGFKIPKFMWMLFIDGLSSFFLSLPTQHDFPPKRREDKSFTSLSAFYLLPASGGLVGRGTFTYDVCTEGAPKADKCNVGCVSVSENP